MPKPRTPVAVALLLAACSTPLLADDLADAFRNPPESAKPRTWWHWTSGHVSKEGITADLEAMKKVGLAGAQLFTVEQGPRPEKPVMFMSPEWRALTTHAVAEAKRLNLELTLHACEGWSESGGPWVKPEGSMQQVVWAEHRVTGGSKVDVTLPRPETLHGYYKDIAVLAFPALPGDEVDLASLKPRVLASGGAVDIARLTDNDPATRVTVAPEKGGKAAFVLFEFDRPVTCGSISFAPVSSRTRGDVQISTDGKTFKTLGSFSAGPREKVRQNYVFDPVEVRQIRLRVPNSAAENPWTLGEVRVTGPRVPDFVARSGMESKMSPAPLSADVPAGVQVKPDTVVDLTPRLDPATGKLSWDAPAGEWTVLRLGATTTGATNYPGMEETRGLECDKMSRPAVEAHFKAMIGTILSDAGAHAKGGVHAVLLDSWEAGCQNWTPRMREEFKARRGYDPLTYLPALSGRYVGSPEITERFLWDYRRTIADLILVNHYETFRDLCHQNGLYLTGEAVGIGMPVVADQLEAKGRTDVPMGEFWVQRVGRDEDQKEAASGAHIYGQNVAAAEAFTGQAQVAGWRNDPASLKALGDLSFTLGINRFVFHRYAHQPYPDRVPGVTMGPWGTHFERTNTWWEPGKAWLDYISRCQALLQAGRFHADVAYYYGEGAPVTLRFPDLKPAPPAGYDYDVVNREVLLTKASVKDGRLVLASGMEYRALVLPDTDRMTPQVAAKVKEFAHAGLTVIGPKPAKSPSLTDYPKCDADVKAVADEVWGNVDGKTVTERAVGKGKVVWGKKLEDVLGVAPDFEARGVDGSGFRFIHRVAGGADVYFVSNQRDTGQTALCTFRVTGKQPEFFRPDTGAIEPAAVWIDKDGRTTVPVRFDPAGSVFVVFRDKPKLGPIADVTRAGQSIFSPAAPTTQAAGQLAITKAEYGALEAKGNRRDVTGRLSAAIKNGELSINATNDTLGGDPAPQVPKQLRVAYTYNDRPATVTLAEGQPLRLPAQPEAVLEPRTADLTVSPDGQVSLVAWQPGPYEVVTPDGQKRPLSVNAPAPAVALTGPWNVRFQPGRLAPESATFEKLSSWTEHADAGIKYFSGTATYSIDFDVPDSLPAPTRRLALDLGRVRNLAEVTVNGKPLGVLWKPPFRADVTGVVKPGKNRLEVRVTNLWPNRLIGDQGLEESKRVTWTTHNPYTKDSPLLESGLLGPVRIECAEVVPLAAAPK